MRLLHDPLKISASFDDPNLVSRAGLVPVMALAERAGLHALVRRHVQITARTGVYPEVKAACLVGMAAGADSIDDMDLLRHGAMPDLFGGVRAPSTLGSFLRSFTWGNVRQLERVSRELLAELARARLLPGAQTLAFVDLDSMQRRVYGIRSRAWCSGTPILKARRCWSRAERAAATICTLQAARRSPQPGRAGKREDRPRRRLVHRRGDRYRPGRWTHRDDRGPGRLGALLRGVHRRLPPGRGILLGHRADESRGQDRDRLDTSGRVDAHQVPAGDLGRPAAGLGVRRRDRRDPIHRVRLEEGPGGHRPADRPPSRRT